MYAQGERRATDAYSSTAHAIPFDCQNNRQVMPAYNPSSEGLSTSPEDDTARAPELAAVQTQYQGECQARLSGGAQHPYLASAVGGDIMPHRSMSLPMAVQRNPTTTPNLSHISPAAPAPVFHPGLPFADLSAVSPRQNRALTLLAPEHELGTAKRQVSHPYARINARKEQDGNSKRRRIWNHALEKDIFSPEEVLVFWLTDASPTVLTDTRHV
jgi:hypothetical protein